MKTVFSVIMAKSGLTDVKMSVTCLYLEPGRSTKRVDLLSNLELSQSAIITRILLCRLVNLVKEEGFLQFDNTCLLVFTEPHKGHKLEEALSHLTKFAKVCSCD